MTTYTWNILQLLTVPQEDQFTDVVVMAQWKLTGTDGDFVGSIINNEKFTLQQGEGFTPYNQLTEQQVIGWIQNALGADQIARLESLIEQQIAKQKNPSPTPQPQPLPWAQN